MAEETTKVAPAEPIKADPAALGLGAFALTTLLFSLVNAGIIQQGPDPSQQIVNLFLPLALFYGGIAQLIAGLFEFRTGNTFAFTAFISYGAFWISLAGMNLLARQGVVAETRLAEAQGWFFLGWTIFTIIMFIASFGTTPALAVTFALLLGALIVLTIGDLLGGPEGSGLVWIQVGGWLGILAAAGAWYVGAGHVFRAHLGRTLPGT